MRTDERLQRLEQAVRDQSELLNGSEALVLEAVTTVAGAFAEFLARKKLISLPELSEFLLEREGGKIALDDHQGIAIRNFRMQVDFLHKDMTGQAPVQEELGEGLRREILAVVLRPATAAYPVVR